MFYEKLQADLVFLEDIIAAHVIDVFSKYPSLLPAHAENPQEVWDVFCRRVLGPLMCIQMDGGGDWKHEVWTELRSERRLKLLFRGLARTPGFLRVGMVWREEFASV